jgi:hypothetical protein
MYIHIYRTHLPNCMLDDTAHSLSRRSCLKTLCPSVQGFGPATTGQRIPKARVRWRQREKAPPQLPKERWRNGVSSLDEIYGRHDGRTNCDRPREHTGTSKTRSKTGRVEWRAVAPVRGRCRHVALAQSRVHEGWFCVDRPVSRLS